MTADSPERPPLRDRCKALVEEWRDTADEMAYQDSMVQGAYCLAHGDLADELEAVLEDYDR